jgi:hypothetical protein
MGGNIKIASLNSFAQLKKILVIANLRSLNSLSQKILCSSEENEFYFFGGGGIEGAPKNGFGTTPCCPTIADIMKQNV